MNTVKLFWKFFFTYYWHFFAIYSKCRHKTSKLIGSEDCSHCIFSDGGSDSSVSDGPPVHLQFTASRVCSIITINKPFMYSIISDISIVSICKLRLNHSPIALPSQCRTFYLTVCKDVLCISTVMKEWFNEFFFLLSQEQNVCTMHIRELINKYTHFNYISPKKLTFNCPLSNIIPFVFFLNGGSSTIFN